MGSLSINNGNNEIHSNGFNGKIQSGGDQAQRRSCWYEEEIEENLRWSFALNRYLLLLLIIT